MTESKKNAIIKSYCKEAHEDLHYIKYLVYNAIFEDRHYFIDFIMKPTKSAPQLQKIMLTS